MAKRPVFVPKFDGPPFVEEVEVEFEWFPGFSKAQAQRSIASQHAAAAQRGLSPILEISSKSPEPLGIALSAFNLMLHRPEAAGTPSLSVECAFQGSKVFENGGPYIDLYSVPSREARTDDRIRDSGKIVGFRLFGEDFPTIPLTGFYDWLYITALWQNPELSARLKIYRAFSDIAFNPERSINCQARSAALYVALSHNASIECAVSDRDYYFSLIT